MSCASDRVPRSDGARSVPRTTHSLVDADACQETHGSSTGSRSLTSIDRPDIPTSIRNRPHPTPDPTASISRSLTCLSRSFIRVHQARTDLQVSPMAKPAGRVTPSARPSNCGGARRSLDARAISIAMRSPSAGTTRRQRRVVGRVPILGSSQAEPAGRSKRSQEPGLLGVFGEARSERSTAATRSRAISRYCTRFRGAGRRTDALHRALDHCTLPLHTLLHSLGLDRLEGSAVLLDRRECSPEEVDSHERRFPSC